MQLNFVNGNNLQKSACRTVAHNLLNLPFDDIPLNITVEFVPDPNPSVHNEFATTDWTYGSPTSLIQIAEVAPNWKHPWKGVQFLQEVFAHELGHSFFAALPTAQRVRVAKMFGAASDSPTEINPQDAEWEDRVVEGIAETFKDAFLPQRFRRYANRTQKRLSISRYPEFRALFRLVPGERLSAIHPDGRNTYELDVPPEYFPGTFYEPQTQTTGSVRQLTAGAFVTGPAPKGSVIRVRIRPYALINGLAPGSFSRRFIWRVHDENVFSSNVEIEWNANEDIVKFRSFVASADDGADYFNLELLGSSSFPGSPTEKYNIGLPEGDLRGFNVTIPEDIAELTLASSFLGLFEPPGGDDDPSQDADRIASFKTMTEGTGVSVTPPRGSIAPGDTEGGRVPVRRRVSG